MISDVGVSAYTPKGDAGGLAESYHPLSISGEAAPENIKAIKDIHAYLENSGVYNAVDQKLRYLTDNKAMEVSFDRKLSPDVFGQTARNGSISYGNWDVSLNPRIYEISYMDLEEGSDEQLIAQYLQSGVPIHEKVHKVTLESPKVNKAMAELEKMGYGENNLRGFLEMLAEKYTIESFLDAGEKDVAWMGRRHTPYRRALEAGDNIDSFFVYGEKEKYRGLEGFIDALADGALSKDKETVDKYLGGLEVKLDAAKPYEPIGYSNMRNYLHDMVSEKEAGLKKEIREYGLYEPVKAKEPIKLGLGVIAPSIEAAKSGEF